MPAPLSVPLLDPGLQDDSLQETIDAAVLKVARSGRFTSGPQTQHFEDGIADYCGVDHAVAVSSGTDALVAAMMATGIGPGDEVVTSPFTSFATAGSIARLGARPVFADIEAATFNIDASRIEATVNDRTRALLPVHLFGRTVDMRLINRTAREHDLVVIEDAAQATGARHNGRAAGALGHIGCLSFSPCANLGGAGEGGMVVTNDAEYARITRQLRNHGMEPAHMHPRIGGNFRPDELQAAVLNAKLGQIDRWQEQRRGNAQHYRTLLGERGLSRPVPALASGLEGGLVLPEDANGNEHACRRFVVYAENRDALVDHLTAEGIGCEAFCPVPLHRQECFRLLGYGPGDFPNAERAATMNLSLPVHPGLTEAMIERVVDVLESGLRKAT